MATKTPTRLKALTPPVRRTELRLVAQQAASDVPTTPYLNLNLPPTGFPSWGPDLNQNFSAIDAAVGALQRSYQGDWVNNRVYAAGQIVIFNGGVFISLASGNIGLQPDLHPEAWGPMGSAVSITYPPPGIAVSQGSTGWAPSINPATIPPYPNAGVPVSTSTAWAASIPVANIVVTNPSAATVIDTGWNQWELTGSAPAPIPGSPAAMPATTFVMIAGQHGQATTGTTGQIAGLGASLSLNGGQGGNAPAGSTNGAGGTVWISGGRTGTGPGAAGAPGDVYINSNWGHVYLGGPGGAGGGFHVRPAGAFETTVNSGPSGIVAGSVGGALTTWNIGNGVGETDWINSSGGAGGGFRWYNVPPGTLVNSATATAMSLGSNNILTVTGLIATGSKNFKILHPLEDNKWLIHSCIEGPEIAVFYRGEAETEDGVAEITLPDYFEALTFSEDRTVSLTELYEDEDNPVFGNFLASGRIRDGKFKVRSSTESVKFFWEVKAVRRAGGVDRLEVVRDIEEADRNVVANRAIF